MGAEEEEVVEKGQGMEKGQKGRSRRGCSENFFFNGTATNEIYTSLFVGSVRCVIRDS